MMAPSGWVGKLSTWGSFPLSLALWSSLHSSLCTLLWYECIGYMMQKWTEGWKHFNHLFFVYSGDRHGVTSWGVRGGQSVEEVKLSWRGQPLWDEVELRHHEFWKFCKRCQSLTSKHSWTCPGLSCCIGCIAMKLLQVLYLQGDINDHTKVLMKWGSYQWFNRWKVRLTCQYDS